MDKSEPTRPWQFTRHGTFELADPHKHNDLYFPLVNESGLIAAITPTLHGDIKTGQHTFLTPPVSVEDLHSSRAARNFWVNLAGAGAWSVTGNAAPQIARRFDSPSAETVKLEAGYLWHTLTRTNAALGLRAEITNFVPASTDTVELMRVTLTNVGARPLTLTPTAAIPIYGRSADNLRDHRHVTSLLHRIQTHRHGVVVCPTLVFNERGHRPNSVTYAVLGAEADGTPPEALLPVSEDFIGAGGTFDWPEAVVAPLSAGVPAGQALAGYEACGGLRFSRLTLLAGQSQSYILILAIWKNDAPGADPPADLLERYGSAARFETWLARTETHWRKKLDTLQVTTRDATFDLWLKWVTLQPILRRLCGNSFLPYHDYGRGGRGWRDLWQDSLASLITETNPGGELLFSHFAGVRVDGSNATIIGAQPGEFSADRNHIPRVWMDHGAWPLLTTRLYIDQTGDVAFLLREQTYFKDQLTHRAQCRDAAWQPEQGLSQRTATGAIYHGTVLEHLLLQQLTPFFNVGEHNIIRLEDADWNDGLDMAGARGESVALTALYAGNFRQLSEMAGWLETAGAACAEIAAEIMPLLDTLTEPVDYAVPAAKQQRLAAYFETCRHTLSGRKVRVGLAELARDLRRKADWLGEHIRTQEWLTDPAGYAWFNGYYDNAGQRVEGAYPPGVRLTLTGQVFTLMSGLATDPQARACVRAVEHYLFDPQVGGYRLNTDFGDGYPHLGRCFGFAFGHKENGAMFSHMAVMYANALYRRGLVQEGHRVLERLYRHCLNFSVSRMYPGLPEYIDPRGRGRYPYLTGSASWYLLTLVTEVFGVRGVLGHLTLAPKLVRTQFNAAGQARLKTLFAGKPLEVCYCNPEQLDYDAYQIETVQLNDVPVPLERTGAAVIVSRPLLLAQPDQPWQRLVVGLGRKPQPAPSL